MVASDCTLPSAEQPLRVAEFDALFAQTLRAVERPAPDHVRLVLVGDDSLPARVASLTERETACCSFFAFTLRATDLDSDEGTVQIAVDVRVPAARTDVLTALTGRAEAFLTAPAL